MLKRKWCSVLHKGLPLQCLDLGASAQKQSRQWLSLDAFQNLSRPAKNASISEVVTDNSGEVGHAHPGEPLSTSDRIDSSENDQWQEKFTVSGLPSADEGLERYSLCETMPRQRQLDQLFSTAYWLAPKACLSKGSCHLRLSCSAGGQHWQFDHNTRLAICLL